MSSYHVKLEEGSLPIEEVDIPTEAVKKTQIADARK